MRAVDIEVFQNYFLVMGKDFDTGKVTVFEMYDGKPLDGKAVMAWLKADENITFNGSRFDLPILGQACAGKSCSELKALCNKIIVEEVPLFALDIYAPTCKHIDLFDPAPGVGVSLKGYGARMHMHHLQDLPIPHDALISPEQRKLLISYCENDLDTTIALYRAIEQQIALRRAMSRQYGIDLRSKSDAQIAEAVICSEVVKETRQYPSKPGMGASRRFKYIPPDFISFQTAPLQQMLEAVRGMTFNVLANGSPKCDALDDYKVVIGETTYRMGVGGLHSCEKSVAHIADDEYVIVDRDVASYYPAIILNCQLYPKHIGPEFLKVYRSIVQRRLEAKTAAKVAKKAGNRATELAQTVIADSLKITINGSFGKFGSIHSRLYSPDLLIQTTVTGQLSLLMLIELLESHGIRVVSANTDGIVIKCRHSQVQEMNDLIKLWEFFTGFETEETRYRALYAKDVNNYIAIKSDGVKTKGLYAEGSLKKHPFTAICTDAVIAYLTAHTPLEKTIVDCTDVSKFVGIRGVRGGGQYNGEMLGKVVRWYYSTASTGCITSVANGNKVAKTDGAKPLMTLPDTVPDDIDYAWYVNEAKSILKAIGVK